LTDPAVMALDVIGDSHVPYGASIVASATAVGLLLQKSSASSSTACRLVFVVVGLARNIPREWDVPRIHAVDGIGVRGTHENPTENRWRWGEHV